MLLPLEEFRHLLICPHCQSALITYTEYLTCSNRDCCYGNEEGFPYVREQPVLVDFTDSILNRDDVFTTGGESTVTRNSNRLQVLVKDRMFRSGAVATARRIAARIYDELESERQAPLVLIVGGGSRGIGTDILMDGPRVGVISFDIYASQNTQFLADGHRIPLDNCSVDAVWVQYVLEHVLDPWRVVAEIHRVLRSDGLVYAETPFLQQVHEGPYDFTRFTHSGHRWLFRQFGEIDSGISMGLGVQQMWSVEHLFRGIFRSERAGQGAKFLASYGLRMLERLIPISYRYDSASSFYFFGRKSGTQLSPLEIVRYYRGAKRFA